MSSDKVYIAIDLKSFYASVECIERKLNPMTTNLVVADMSRTEKTIGLAVSPSLKSFGIPGRPRLFEIVQKVKVVNNERRRKAGKLVGESYNINELNENPSLAVGYIVAPPRMSLYERAAQFSPFAALTGYEDAVEETARLTDARLELSEDMKTILNEKMQMIVDNWDAEPIVTITYFVPDKKKEGGAYVDVTGIVKEIDEYERCIVLADKKKIPIEQVRAIEGDLFKCLEL